MRLSVRQLFAALAVACVCSSTLADERIWGDKLDRLVGQPGVTTKVKVEIDGGLVRTFELPGPVSIEQSQGGALPGIFAHDNSGEIGLLCLWENLDGAFQILDECVAEKYPEHTATLGKAVARIDAQILTDSFGFYTKADFEEARLGKHIWSVEKLVLPQRKPINCTDPTLTGPDFEEFMSLPTASIERFIDAVTAIRRFPVYRPCY